MFDPKKPFLSGFFADLVNSSSELKTEFSKDGTAFLRKGEISSGIEISQIFRDSNSTGLGLDVKIGDSIVRHFESEPKFDK